jgi:hypothetical protein
MKPQRSDRRDPRPPRIPDLLQQRIEVVPVRSERTSSSSGDGLLVGLFGSSELVLGSGLLILEVLEFGSEGFSGVVLAGDGLFGDGDLEFDLMEFVLQGLRWRGTWFGEKRDVSFRYPLI